MDVTGANEAADRIASELCRDTLRISAVTGAGIPPLIRQISALLDELPPTIDEPPVAAMPARAASRSAEVRRAVVDLGNSRLKWGWIDTSGRVVDVVALPLNDPNAWDVAWQRETMASVANSVAIATVNPPIAARLGDFLHARGATTRWFQSAADVPVRHEFAFPDRTGADRALAVAAAIAEQPAGTPGLVVLCGTALTVERVSSEGIWQGGAIAAGLGLTARSLHQMTAQLPLIDSSAARDAPRMGTRHALGPGGGRSLGRRRSRSRTVDPPGRRPARRALGDLDGRRRIPLGECRGLARRARRLRSRLTWLGGRRFSRGGLTR